MCARGDLSFAFGFSPCHRACLIYQACFNSRTATEVGNIGICRANPRVLPRSAAGRGAGIPKLDEWKRVIKARSDRVRERRVADACAIATTRRGWRLAMRSGRVRTSREVIRMSPNLRERIVSLPVSESRMWIAGIPFVRADTDRAVGMICEDARVRRGRLYIVANAHAATLRRQSSGYAQLLGDTEKTVCLADGRLVERIARGMTYGGISVAPPADLLERCCARCAELHLSMFLLGGSSGVAVRMAYTLRGRHEGLKIEGWETLPEDGPDAQCEDITRKIADSRACVLLVGDMSPGPEMWVYSRLSELAMPVVCLGMDFDYGPRWDLSASVTRRTRLALLPQRAGALLHGGVRGSVLFLWDALWQWWRGLWITEPPSHGSC